jgi:hypothetical protein
MKWKEWLYKKKKEKTFTELRNELSNIVEELFAKDPTASNVIRQIVFDTKYKSDMVVGEEDTPSGLVDKFNIAADTGDNEFLRHYFYRVLRRNHDPVVRKLKYRLKRSN